MMEPVAWRLDKALDGYETPMNGSREVILRFSSDEEFSFFIDAISTGKVGVRLSDAEARIAELEAAYENQQRANLYLSETITTAEARAEAAEALLNEAREALEPFADVLEEYDPQEEEDWMPSTLIVGSVSHYALTMGDFRAARAIHHKIGVKDE